MRCVRFDPWCHRPPESKFGVQSRSSKFAYSTQEEAFEALFRTVVADTNRWQQPNKAPKEFGHLFRRKCQELNPLLDNLEATRELMPISPRPGASNIEKRWHGMRNLRLGGVLLRDIVDRAINRDFSEASDMPSPAQESISAHPLWPAYEHSSGQAMYHRRLFTTRLGYLGIGSRTLVRGDKICVLLGCVVPVILRPQGNRYSLIGECYVHGIMNGECLQKAESQKAHHIMVEIC
jgi:hypothetical protein